MSDMNMTEEDLRKLQQSINDGLEPPQELAKKLFPSLYAGFDFRALKDSRIPTIEYQGKRPEAAILNAASTLSYSSAKRLWTQDQMFPEFRFLSEFCLDTPHTA